MRNFQDRLLVKLIALLLLFFLGMMTTRCAVAKPSVKAKFYDFSEHLIDGQVKSRKPCTLMSDRLLNLKDC